MTEAFVRNIDAFVNTEGVDLVTFEKGQRKDDITQKYLRSFGKSEGVVYVGKAQEKARVMRTERRRRTGGTYPWIVESTAMVNHYYFYCVDEDFGPFFLKFCSYFPHNAKLCINGHEYLKRQLAKRGVAFEALDNGVKSCADPRLMQRLCDGRSAKRIDRLLRKWLRRLPHPFPARDRAAGYRYQLSILQAEFALTQVPDQFVTGRVFFEEVIRENLDVGRPSQVSLVFDRRISRRTPGRFRTRVITDGVVPSLHVDYKKARIRQYHKEGQALRIATTINDTRDFAIGRRIENLDDGHNAPPEYKFKVYTAKQKRGVTPQIQREMRRRAAVEPVIGYIKNEHRMNQNYLAHRSGDANNAILAVAGYNFSLLIKWLRFLLHIIQALLAAAPKLAAA
jgi:hypothetical protein